jgi:uncharacterized protein (TIGR00369 family)
VRLLRFHADGVTIGCNVREELRNAAGVLHGGVAATLADVSVGVALTHHLGRPRAATTVEMKINYLRPVADGKVTARAHLVRVGKNLCTARVDVFNGSKQPAAVAPVTYMIRKAATGIPSRSIRSIESERRGVVRPFEIGP